MTTSFRASIAGAGRFSVCAAERQSYSRLQQVSHWAIALLCVVEFPTARGIQRAHLGHAFGIEPPKLDAFFASAHEWAGWIILALVLILIGSRALYGSPTLPSGMRGWQRWLAHAAHAAIYLSLLALVGSGATAMYIDGRFAFSACAARSGGRISKATSASSVGVR